MTLRERQTDLTRVSILDAAVDFFLDDGEADLTMQRVADRAGVSLRTVYRHFDDRAALVEAIGDRIRERMSDEKGRAENLPGGVEEFVHRSHESIETGVTYREMVRKALILAIADGDWYVARDEHLWEVFREEYPHLPDTEARADFAVLRHVISSNSVILVGERFGIDPGDLAQAVRRAGEALVHAVAERDHAAGEGEQP